ncbi:MAG: glycosyltransferase family 2 protein [Halobacteriota archaeon]
MSSKHVGLISVLVPVYNAESYLSRCVDSIIAQSYQNIEIILVDDGSTDRCGDICDRYAASGSRISVIHKTHGGPGSARNAGLSRAQGEYIGFVDADDYISPTMYENLYMAAVTHKADIVQTGMITLRDDGVVTDTIKSEFSIFLTPSTCFSAYLRQKIISHHLVNKLYDRRILESRHMVEDYLFEDPIEVLHSLGKCHTVVALDLTQYFQVSTPNSITRGLVGRWHLESILRVAEMMQECILVDAPQCCDETHRLFCRFSLEGYYMLNRARLPSYEKSKYAKEFVDRFKSHYARLRKTRAYEYVTLQEKTAFMLFAINPELYRTANNIFMKRYLLKLEKAGINWGTKSGY